MTRALVASLALSLGLSFAARADDGRVPVFISDVAVDKGVTVDGQALTSTLCSAFGKAARLDVMCAPDVKQLVSFAGQLAMMGKKSPAIEKLEAQMTKVRWVVRAELKKGDKGGLVFHLGVHDKVSGDNGVFAVAGERRALFKEPLPDGKTARLLDRIPVLAKQATEQMLASTASPPPPALEGAK